MPIGFRLRRILPVAVVLAAVLGALVCLNNASRFAAPRAGLPTVLAHRGVAQQFERDGPGGGCEAERMKPPVHDYIENTIRSIGRAFELGASVVEFDVQLTADREWAVFHDRRLECRTDGAGRVRDQTLAALKLLDVGYGYTADGGMTYPFRGQGFGGLPSMREVFEAFPDRAFLIDLKAASPEDGEALAESLATLRAGRLENLTVFGADAALAAFREHLRDVPVFSFGSVRRCLVGYIIYGWTGILPSACRGTPVYVPINVATFLWGWPNRFLDRMDGAGSPVVVVGRFGPRAFAPGVDTREEFARLPIGYDGGVWTNEVARIKGAIDR